MTDAMHWSPDPPVAPVPWLRIDVASCVDPVVRRQVIERAVADFMADRRRTTGIEPDPIG